MGNTVQEALAARKGRTTSTDNSVEAALKRRKEQIESRLGSIKNDIYERYQSAINAYNSSVPTYKPTYGKESADKFYESNSQNSIDVDQLKRDVEAYRSYLGEEYADSMIESLGKLSDGYKSAFEASNFHSQFKDEEDYNVKYGYQAKYQGKSYDHIESKWKTDRRISDSEREWLKTYGENYGYADDNYYTTYTKSVEDRLSKIDAEIESAKAAGKTTNANFDQKGVAHISEYNRQDEIDALEAERTQLMAQKNRIGSKREAYESVKTAISDPDFAKYADVGKALKNPTASEAYGGIFGIGSKEGEIQNIVTFTRDNQNDLYFATDDGVADGPGGSKYVYTLMDENEVEVYNYFLGKGDEKSAQEYLDWLVNEPTDGLMKRWSDNVGETIGEFGIIGNLMGKFGSGIGGYAENARNLFHPEYASDFRFNQGISAKLDENLAEYGPVVFNDRTLGQTAGDLAGNLGNMVPSLVFSAIPGAGTILFPASVGVGAAGDAYTTAISEGYDVADARAYSTAVGVTEAALSYLLDGVTKVGGSLSKAAIGKLTSKLSKASTKAVFNFVGKMGSEYLEENLQEGLFEPVWSNIFLKTDKDVDLLSEEALYAGMLGALSAGMTNAGGSAAKALAKRFDYKDAKETYAPDSESLQGLVDSGLENSISKELAEKMQARIDGGKKVSGKDIYNLVQANENAIRSEDIETIKEAAFSRLQSLGESGGVSVIADIIAKKVSGEALTKSEQAVLESSKYGIRVSNEMSPENIGTGEYSNAWAESIGTERINKDAYNYAENQALRKLAEETAGVSSPISAESAEDGSSLKDAANSTQAVKMPSAEDLSLSEDGKTRIASTDTEVAIKGVKTVETKGESGKKAAQYQFKVVDNDGNESYVDTSDIEYGSESEGLLYESFVELGIDPAYFDSYVANFDKNDFEYKLGDIAAEMQYALGFNEAVNLGKVGLGGGYKVASEDGKSTVASTYLENGQFTKDLKENVRNLAYNLGKIASEKRVEAEAKNIEDAVNKRKESGKGKVKKKGTLHYEKSVDDNLNDNQKAGLKYAERLTEYGIDVYVFRSTKDANGNRVDDRGKLCPNGFYRGADGSIHVDLYAGEHGNGLMVYTLGHELGHHGKRYAPREYKIFKDLLYEWYGEQYDPDHDSSIDELIRKRMEDEDLDWDAAEEEVVADFCEPFLTDGNIEERVAQLKAADEKTFNFVQKIIQKIWNMVKSIYSKINPDSTEGQFAREHMDSLERVYDAFAKMTYTASENLQWLGSISEAKTASETLGAAGVFMDTETGSAVMNSVRYAPKTDAEVDKVAKALSESMGVSVKQAEKWVRSETSLASIILDPSNTMFLDYEADERYEAIKKNAEYPQGTVDFSNLCKKRREFTALYDKLQKEFPNRVFTAEDLEKIRQILIDEKIEVACGLCYVEERRQLLGEIAQGFIDGYKNGTLKEKVSAALDANDTYVPTIYDLITYDGYRTLTVEHPSIAEAFKIHNNARGMQAGRLIEGLAEYKREILGWSQKKVDFVNSVGGLRVFSFSDFEATHLLDLVQVIQDCAAKGVMVQAYTKVPAFANAVKDTNVKVNRSLIANGTGIKIVDGRQVLDLDPVEGININDKDFFDSTDSKSIGNILVGMADDQIRLAMKSDFVDYIIPFHTGLKKDILHAKKIDHWTNYKNFQTDKDLAYGKVAETQINVYVDVIQAAERDGKPIKNKVEFVNKFLSVAKERGIKPRFWNFLDVDSNGDYVYTEGYHKFLVDFKLFDKNGNILPQKPVVPVFDDALNARILNEYVEGKKSPVSRDKVYDRLVKEVVEAGDTKKSTRKKRDYDYLNAVNRGDMETAQKMVEEAAKAAGYDSPMLYHGTKMFGFTKVKTSGVEKGVAWSPFFAANKEDISASYVPYGKVRDISSSMDDDAIYEAIEIAIEERKENISDLVYDFRHLIDMHFSPWVFGQTDNSYLEGLVEKANPEAGHGDGVYDVLSEIVYDSFYDYRDEFGEYEDADDWSENSPEGKKIFDKIVEIEGEKAALHSIESGEELGGIYQLYANLNNMYVVDWARDNGFDGVIFKNIRDNGAYGRTPAGDVYAFFSPESQVKSADPVTYDDNGDVIPLSERFNHSNDDIRYSKRKKQKISAKDLSYASLVALPDITGTVLNKKQQVNMTPAGKIDDIWLCNQVFSQCETVKTNAPDPVHYLYSDALGKNVEITMDGIRHGYHKSNKKTAQKAAPREILNARAALNLHDLLKTAVVVNLSTKHTNKYTPYAYVMMSVMGMEDANGTVNHYAVRMLVQERLNDDAILVEAEVLGRLSAVNAKKIDTPHLRNLSKKDTSLRYSGQFGYSVADLLGDVKNIFPDTFTNDVYANLGMKRKPGKELADHLVYQTRKSGTSARSMLANALESVAQNDIERNKLNQYKEKIDLLNAEEKKLRELNEELRKLSFPEKGTKRDQKKINDLRFEANRTVSRINTLDKMLFDLEASTPLKKVLEREKALATKREKQKAKEALTAYKEKVAATQREIISRYQESKKRGIESRSKTEMRRKIKSVVKTLNDYLLHGTKDKHVPLKLQKAVAEALDMVNMDTVGADERVAKYNALIAKETNPDIIASLTKTRNRIQEQGNKVSDRIANLKSAYEEIKTSQDPDIVNAYDEAIANLIDRVEQDIGNTSLRDMTLGQLEEVYDMYRAVLNTVRKANSLFKMGRDETISTVANRVLMELDETGKRKDYALAGKLGGALRTVKEFDWNNLKPVYAFERIGSKTLSQAFENVRKGEDTWAVDIGEAKSFKDAVAKKYRYDEWDFDKVYTFKSTTGQEFKLSLEQMLSLYAYSKRAQADEHLSIGGFVFNDSIEIHKEKEDGKKSKLKYTVNTAKAYKVDKTVLAEIISVLKEDPNKIGFVDEMQDYLSTVMGAKGNEVSMALYDIKLYKEKNYFPLKSAQQYMFEQNQVAGEVRIKNSGFSKGTVVHARNPIILDNFLDVWANHVNDMSMYHAFVLPLEDFNRVFNYKTPISESMDGESVKAFIQDLYGKRANEYISQLLKDLNGGARVDPKESISKKMIGRFKKSSAFGSLSVVVQQPSAVARALAEIDMKYFDFNPKLISHKKLWEELKKYAPVAVIKEMGHFDTDMGMSTVDYIKGEKSLMDKVDNLVSLPASIMDELTWCHIWAAVKREVAAKNKGLKGEELMQKCGERFTEVVSKTQVYDSVLSRSANMRSKGVFMNMLTSFMAEPTTAINMIENAVTNFKRGNKAAGTRQILSVAASVVLNSALVSLIYAMRDDDEDETYLEKYAGSLVTELIDGFNPATYYPIIKDVWSALQGYDIERSDMSLITKGIDSLKSLISVMGKDTSDMTEEELSEHMAEVANAWIGVGGDFASMFGLPIKNIVREVQAVINTVDTANNDLTNSWSTAAAEMLESAKNTIPVWGWMSDESKSDKLYDAITNGDQNILDRLTKQYKDEDALNTAIRKGLRDNDPRIREAAQAQIDGNPLERVRIAEIIESEGFFSQDNIKKAINAEVNKLSPDENSFDSSEGEEDKVTSYYSAGDVSIALENGDIDEAKVIIKDLIDTKVANGDTEKKAKGSIKSALTAHWKPIYKTASYSEQARIRKLLFSTRLYDGSDDVVKMCRNWLKDED